MSFEVIRNGGKLECARFEQSSVTKCLVAEMCKQWEIYKRISVTYEEETYFRQNNY